MKKRTYLLGLCSALVFSVGVFNTSMKTDASEATVYDGLKTLLSDYYGTGTYKKESNIYVDESKVNEDLTVFFHAKANTTSKVTYYTKDALWMSRGNGTYSYYGTSYSDAYGQEPNGLTNATATTPYVTPAAPGIALKGENQNSMEQYYVTLKDFIEGTHTSAHTENKTLDLATGWEVSEGVYSTNNPDVIDGFRLFTAPLWLGKTKENGNYIDYTKATIQEVGSNLVMKLWTSIGDEGKLVDGVETDGENLVFSKAVVSKGQTGANMQKAHNLQEGLGTNFEGYSLETQPELFEAPLTTPNKTNNWKDDTNGNAALGIQTGYANNHLVEENENIVLKIGGNKSSKLYRFGLALTNEVGVPGTYVAKIKIKRGPDATIPKFFFKINKNTYIDSNSPLQYIKDGPSSVAGFFFNNTDSTDPNLNFEFDTEWKEYTTTFTIDEGSKVDTHNGTYTAAFVMYMGDTNSSGKHYLLIDDFEIYRVNESVDYGTDFEGYNSTDHAALFENEVSSGWKEDSYSRKSWGVQSDYNGVRLAEENDNIAVRIGGLCDSSAGTIRAHFDVNDDIKEPGVYKVRLKMKLDENSEAIDKVGFRINPKSDTKASSGLTYRTYFKYADEVTITNEWAIYETDLVIKSDDEVVTSTEDLVMSMFIYTNNANNAEDRGLFVDDLEIYRYTY